MYAVFKLLLSFLYWGEVRFKDKAKHIVTSMTTEPMLTLVPNPFPADVPTRASALTAMSEYEAAAQLAKDGSKSAINARNDKRAIVEGILEDWAPFLEFTAQKAGDINILQQSGYDLRQPNQPVPQPVAAPEFKVYRNGFSGKIYGRCPAVDGATGYEGQICIGTDTAEANWRKAFFSSGCKNLVFDGLTPGQVYTFRLRALGRDGWSAWSNIAQLMAT